jgi:AraC family transcriptional regulator
MLRTEDPLIPERSGTTSDGRTIAIVFDHIDLNFHQKLRLVELAKIAGLSPWHFIRRFKVTAGRTPHQYIIEKRICAAKHLLENTTASLVEIAYDVGFSSQAHFTVVFRDFVGTTPRAYRTSQ